MAIYGAVLFFLLSPGVLFRFPSKKPIIVLVVHAVLFAIIYQLTYKAVYRQIYGREGFAGTGASNAYIYFIMACAVVFIILMIPKAFSGKKTLGQGNGQGNGRGNEATAL
jgi:hypothetical protein